MFEASKTRRIRGEAFVKAYFSGSVLDIGCGPDLVVPHAQPFDVEHGDANTILDFLAPNSFDCVHSSHCLEHMTDPPRALEQWWALVRPGGFLIVVVPDEDLYEQGVWPSEFNPDHKATFRLDKQTSWSPVSYDVRILAGALPGGTIIECSLHDNGYDRRMMRKGSIRFKRNLLRMGCCRELAFRKMMKRGLPLYKMSQTLARLEHFVGKPIDQTMGEAVAQIQMIVHKRLTKGEEAPPAVEDPGHISYPEGRRPLPTLLSGNPPR